MVAVIKAAWKCILAGIVAIAILSLFTVFYCNTGIHINNTSGATDYRWESGQLKTTMVEGFSWVRMDANGFNNAYVPSENVNILLMGSSHMEAGEVSPIENTGYLLNVLLDDFYTYNIGMSGHQLYHCVSNLGDAVDTYSPSDYVIIETDRVQLDTESMRKVIDRTYPHIPSYDSGMLYHIQKYAPSIKRIYNQVEVWRNRDVASGEKEAVAETTDESYQPVLNEFLSKAYTDASKNGAQLIIFYKPSTGIDENGAIIHQQGQEYVESFRLACDKNNIIFIDMTDQFEELYETESVLAHGFSNTSVGIGHLNEAGHKVIASTLADVIKGEK